MAQTSSENKDFRNLQSELLKELTSYKTLYDLGEKTQERLSRGVVLTKMSTIIRNVTAMAQPELIMAIERHCEQFDLEYFAVTQAEKDSRISSLRMIRSVQEALGAPFNPKQYWTGIIEDLGERNMDKFVSVPQDAVHLFVKSQTQKLTKAPGRMATTEERDYFQTRKEALKMALKVHAKNCEYSLGQK